MSEAQVLLAAQVLYAQTLANITCVHIVDCQRRQCRVDSHRNVKWEQRGASNWQQLGCSGLRTPRMQSVKLLFTPCKNALM